MRTTTCSAVVLAVVLAACGPPVSDEATVTVDGLVQDEVGAALVGQEVKLWKSDLRGLDSDLVAGLLVSSTLAAYKTINTTADGGFHLEMKGSEANNATQKWAAQFAVTVQRGQGPQSAAVGSEAFAFSNNALARDAGTLRLWDFADGGVALTGTGVKTTLPRVADADPGTHHYVGLSRAAWLAEASALSLEVPLTALAPCQERAVNDTDPCTPVTTHTAQGFATGGKVRYRTGQVAFTATNPKGRGISLRQANNQSGTTCVGAKNVFDLNDNVFEGTQGVANLTDASYVGSRRCFFVKPKQGPTTVRELYLHNATISFRANAQLVVSTTTGDPSAGATWTTVPAADCTQASWGDVSFLRCAGNYAGTRGVKFELTGGGEAEFTHVGEVVLYDQ